MKRTFNLLVLVALLALTFGATGVTPAKAVSYTLFGVNPFTNNNSTIPNNYGLFYLDRTTGAIMDGKVITLAGYTVDGALGLAVDPTTGTVYVILKVAAVSGRVLGTIDLDTGVATWVGNLGDNFSTIAFRSDGQMFGVTGNGATVPETMYLIDKSNGSKTLATALGNGADGEVIAYNPNDNSFYHWSGNATVVFERIDANSPYTVTPINSGVNNDEVFGAVWDPTQNIFLVHDITNAMSSWDTAGNQTNAQAATFTDVRGMVIVDESVRLFGTTGAGGGGSTLVELNPTTGALISTVGPVGYAVNGLDYDPSSGTLYATTSTNDANFPIGLITIDMTTGAGTPVVALPQTCGGLPSITNVRANAGGTLFAWYECYDDLVVINPATGDVFVVGESGIGTSGYGMSFDASNTLYFVNGGGSIYTINKYSGAATYSNYIGTNAHHGDFHPDTGRYWGIDATGGGAKNIKVVNVGAGAVDANLPTVNNLHTLTFVPGNQPAVDVVEPILTVPANITVPQNIPGGAVVNYTASATDETSPANPDARCTPASGSTFPIGTTTVKCFTLDDQGNAAFGNFNVTVTAAPGGNLLKKPDFPTASVFPYPWRAFGFRPPYTAALDCNYYNFGPCSVVFGPGNRAAFQQVNRTGVFGDTYSFGMYSASQNAPIGGDYRIELSFFNNLNKPMGKSSLYFNPLTHGFELVSGNAGPTGNYNKIIFKFVYNNSSGRAWFDDAFLYFLGGP